MPSADLHINLLGPLEILRDGRSVSFPPSRKTRALLGYLVTTGKQHSRKQLCDLLWEGPSDPRASLRWSLSKLRSVFNEEDNRHIITNRDTVGFVPAHAEVDLYRIQSADENELEQLPLKELEDLVSLFRGVFLEDCEVSDSYRFETWLDSRRETVTRIQRRLFNTLSVQLQTDPEKAIYYTRRFLQFDPYDEQTHIRLIKLLGKSGETEKALEQYHLCRKILEEELNAEPSAALEQARASLIQLKTPDNRKPNKEFSVASPIIGREEQQEQINTVIQKAEKAAATELILITGEPGIGKTRLLKDIAEQLGKKGGTALWGNANYLEMNRPYAPWTELLETVSPNMIPEAIRTPIAPLLPRVGSDSLDGDRNQLFGAVLELLKILSSGKKILGILFDDLQWFDNPSLSLLNYIIRETDRSNIIIACCARTAELEENTRAFRLKHILKREKKLHEIKLPPLTVSQTAALTKTIDQSLNSDQIYQKSKGNPLFTIEITRALNTDSNEALPDSLHSLIRERLSLLDQQTKNLLNWMAVWGNDFSLELLSRASDYPVAQLLSSIEILEHYNIIKAAGQRYTFVHSLVQDAACRQLSEPLKKMIHQRIARVMMAAASPDDSRSTAILHHAERGEDSELVARACLNCGQNALKVFAYKEAAEFTAKGLNHLQKLSGQRKVSIHLELLELYVHPGMVSFRPSNLLNELKKCVGEAREICRNKLVRKGLFLISYLHYQRGDFHNALERTIKAEEAGRLSDSVTMIRAIADTAKCFGMIDQKIDRAETLALEARSLAAEMDLENDFYEIPLALALVNQHKGRYDDAIRFYKQALKKISRVENHWWKCYILQRLPMIELERDNPANALDYCRQLLPVAQKMGGGSEAPFARALEATACYFTGTQKALLKLDGELETLRQLDSQWMIAWLQSITAEHHLTSGDLTSARKRAEEAMDAASRVNRLSEKALACSVLIRLLIRDKKTKEATETLALMNDEVQTPYLLSSRSNKALRKAEDLLKRL